MNTWDEVKKITVGSFTVLIAKDGLPVSGFVKAFDEKNRTVTLLTNQATEVKVTFDEAAKSEKA